MRIRIVLPLLVALASPVEAEKPNIVLVMADDMGYTDAGANLYQWERWTERLERDLEILLEGVRKEGGVHAFEDGYSQGWKVLKGCTRDILVGDCRQYVGYIGETEEY